MVDQGASPSALSVVDDFLEEAVFAEVVAQLSEASSQPADDSMAVWLQPAVAEKLRSFTNGHHPAGVMNDEVESGISVGARVHYGPHHDHVDVTPDGNPVDGYICLVYICGTGALVFSEQSPYGEPIEHRIEVRPNRAVMWQNLTYRHRVEADDNCVPRIMLGPFTIDSNGNFISTGANQIIGGFLQIVCLGIAILCCASAGCLGVVGIIVLAIMHKNELGDNTFMGIVVAIPVFLWLVAARVRYGPISTWNQPAVPYDWCGGSSDENGGSSDENGGSSD